MKLIRAFFMCLGMFTALPCPYRPWDEEARGLMTSCLPAVGLVVGALWYGLSLAGRALLPEALAAALTTALPLLLTGLIHLDGFMDTADALLSWRPLSSLPRSTRFRAISGRWSSSRSPRGACPPPVSQRFGQSATANTPP